MGLQIRGFTKKWVPNMCVVSNLCRPKIVVSTKTLVVFINGGYLKCVGFFAGTKSNLWVPFYGNSLVGI